MAQPREFSDPSREAIEADDPEAYRAPLVAHLEELRIRILRSLLYLCVFWGGGWFAAPLVYRWLEGFLFDPSIFPKGVEVRLAFSNFADAFFLRLKLSFVIGLIASAPLILWELWGFVRPGLKRQERLAVRALAPVSVALFLGGVVFAFFILKPAFRWFVSYIEDFQGAALYQQPGAFAVFILKMVLAFGVGFQMPVVVWFLAKVELLSSESLLKNWRIAVVLITAVSAFLTPSGDFFSLAMMAAPLVVLYFAGILAAKVTERRRLRRG